MWTIQSKMQVALSWTESTLLYFQSELFWVTSAWGFCGFLWIMFEAEHINTQPADWSWSSGSKMAADKYRDYHLGHALKDHKKYCVFC